LTQTQWIVNGVAQTASNVFSQVTSLSGSSLPTLPVGTNTVAMRITTARGAVATSAAITVVVAQVSVSLAYPPAAGYYNDALPLFIGQAITYKMRVNSGTWTPARTELHLSSSDALNGVTPIATASGALEGTWTVAGSGYKPFAACTYSTAGIRACASNGSVALVAATERLTPKIDGPSVASNTGATTYTVSFETPPSATVAKIGLFNADTKEKLAEKTSAPWTFPVTLGQNTTLVAAAVTSSGNESVSVPFNVSSTNQAPTIQFVNIAQAFEFRGGTTIPIIVRAADTDSTITRIELRQVFGGNEYLLSSANSGDLNYSLSLPANDDTIQLVAIAVDSNGAVKRTNIVEIYSRGNIVDPRYYVWTNFNAALKAGNKALSLSFLSPAAQERYGDAIELIILSAQTSPPVFSPIMQFTATPDTAQYLGTRLLLNGKRDAFTLYFVLADDGAWKIEHM
jgi:hypothetical protein